MSLATAAPTSFALAVLLASCAPAAPDAVPDGAFAFGVFGDGPYYGWEEGRFGTLLEDVAGADVDWLVHVGDILWYPCSEAEYEARRARLDAVDLPVVYTPGDNEWADCHEPRPGGYDPLDRLGAIRRIFFDRPGRSLGGRPMALESQAADPAFAGFPENARWSHGGFVFATVHLVGSANAGDPFPGRGPAHDTAVVRRTEAAVAWLDAAFERAAREGSRGVVVITHADLGLEQPDGAWPEFTGFADRLRSHVAGFAGAVLLVHGDNHEQIVDHPLRGPDGRPYGNFTRLETFGSPDIGWVRVVVDTVAGRFSAFEPRRIPGWW